jgi:hypothetical protein
VKDFDGYGVVESVLERRPLARRDAHYHLRPEALAAPRRSVSAVPEVA